MVDRDSKPSPAVPTDPPQAFSPHEAMHLLIYGHVPARALYVAAKLKLADRIQQGFASVEQLAKVVEADAETLYRILRTLSGQGVFREHPGRKFSLTSMGETLLSDAPEGMADFALMMHEAPSWNAYGDILHTVKTGETAFDHVFGKRRFEYVKDDQEYGQVYYRGMKSMARASHHLAADAYDFSDCKCVVDVGGGNGALLSRILARYDHLNGVLIDQTPAIEQARQEIGGPLPRCHLVDGDFFDSVPGGGDVYILQSIVHDWDDDRAVAILKNCRAAMAKNGRVLLVEQHIGAPNRPWVGYYVDIQMMVMTGGRERSEEEYAKLLSRAGLRLARVIPTSGPSVIYEAVAASHKAPVRELRPRKQVRERA
jgi:hypothetical protein